MSFFDKFYIFLRHHNICNTSPLFIIQTISTLVNDIFFFIKSCGTPFHLIILLNQFTINVLAINFISWDNKLSLKVSKKSVLFV